VEGRTEELASAVNQLLDTNKQLKREVQERQAAENALRESEQEIRNALEREKELSELKSRFVSMASHEFRTPLSTISSSADLIEAYKKDEQQEKRERHTNRIKSAVVNLTNILNDFLSLSRLEEGKIEVNSVLFNLEDFCNETLDEITVLLKPGQTINRHKHTEQTSIYLDAKLLKNILFNLLSNAIKYSDIDKPIDCFIKVEGSTLKIRVTDQGIGIPEEEQQHLFSPFFRAHNVENIQGTGLGLNIVKRYVDLMNGEISFESKTGKGTTFNVVIPLLETHPEK
jgi:signal transduction histidine kinase